MTKELREMTNDQLIEYSSEVNKEIRRRAWSEGYAQGKFDAEMDGHFYASPPSIDELIRIGREATETPQQKRDRIVEKAKKDVDKLVSDCARFTFLDNESGGNSTYNRRTTTVEFIVNKEKRTVVALVRSILGAELLERGIAKCAPDDCFNVHIGKAIALRRALGLEVPAEYMNAPQPTEVRVGDEVEFITLGETKRRTVSEKLPDRYRFTRGTWISNEHDMKIIDDSRGGEPQ